jgi:hypothetical protein
VGQGWSLRFEVPQEAQKGFWWAFHFDVHAGRSVENPPRQALGMRELVDKGAKADALHHASDVYLL